MPTIVITGNDTGVGKTRVTAALARELCAHGSVQVVKPVETGIVPGGQGDVAFAVAHAAGKVEGHTLLSFLEPMAPAAAAALEGVALHMDDMLAKYRELPPADFRLVEGAGGIASPLDAVGHDLRDFAMEVRADFIIAVIEDRLGAINQARLAYAYASASRIPVVLWLNEVTPQTDAIRISNREGLTASGLHLCAELGNGADAPQWFAQPWLEVNKTQ